MPWVDIIRGRLKLGDCTLSMTDSTTSEGWLKKTNLSKLGDEPIQALVRLEAARMHAINYTTTGIREYSQWFKGKDNVVADSLLCGNNWFAHTAHHRFHPISRFNACPAKLPCG
jgi:hypothetical protein